nr:MAG TPA: hypothetical protein [Caudoviricetes sp.]
MAANFKDETTEIIAGREIDEYYFHRLNEYDGSEWWVLRKRPTLKDRK